MYSYVLRIQGKILLKAGINLCSYVPCINITALLYIVYRGNITLLKPFANVPVHNVWLNASEMNYWCGIPPDSGTLHEHYMCRSLLRVRPTGARFKLHVWCHLGEISVHNFVLRSFCLKSSVYFTMTAVPHSSLLRRLCLYVAYTSVLPSDRAWKCELRSLQKQWSVGTGFIVYIVLYLGEYLMWYGWFCHRKRFTMLFIVAQRDHQSQTREAQ